MSSQGMTGYCFFFTSKLGIISSKPHRVHMRNLLGANSLAAKVYHGLNKQNSIIPCALIVHSSPFWKDNLNWISCIHACHIVSCTNIFLFVCWLIVCFRFQLLWKLYTITNRYLRKALTDLHLSCTKFAHKLSTSCVRSDCSTFLKQVEDKLLTTCNKLGRTITLGPKKIPVVPVTRPTLIFSADPIIFLTWFIARPYFLRVVAGWSHSVPN